MEVIASSSVTSDTMATTLKEKGSVNITKVIGYPLDLPGAATTICSMVEEKECHQAEDDLWIVLTDKVNVGLLELAESALPSCRDRGWDHCRWRSRRILIAMC